MLNFKIKGKAKNLEKKKKKYLSGDVHILAHDPVLLYSDSERDRNRVVYTKKKKKIKAYSLSRRCVLLSFWFATGLFSMLFAFMAWSRELSVSSRAS